jgi:NitT/TauT family transport system substrate-binding protein
MSPLLGDGRLDDAAYRQTVEALRAGGTVAVLRRAPENAFTHKISDLAAKPAGQASLP